MEMVKRVVMVSGVFVLPVIGFSQIRDTVPQPGRVVAYAADKFAVVRPLNIEFSNASPYNFIPKQGNTALPEGSVNNFSQFRVSANFNFIKRKTWLLGATLGYRYTSVETDMTDPFTSGGKTFDNDYHYLFSALNFTYLSTLFGKRTVYSASIVVDGSDQYVERVKGLLTGVMILKASQQTKMTVGLAVNIDPSTQLPAMPVFTYEHKFNNGLVADITFPKSMYLRKYVLRNSGRISLGAELDRTSFYLYNIDGTSQRYEYRQVDLNPGLMYEQAIGKVVITGKTGFRLTQAARVFRKQDSFNDAVFEAEPDPTFYFSVGLSFNPFTFLKKNK